MTAPKDSFQVYLNLAPRVMTAPKDSFQAHPTNVVWSAIESAAPAQNWNERVWLHQTNLNCTEGDGIKFRNV